MTVASEEGIKGLWELEDVGELGEEEPSHHPQQPYLAQLDARRRRRRWQSRHLYSSSGRSHGGGGHEEGIGGWWKAKNK